MSRLPRALADAWRARYAAPAQKTSHDQVCDVADRHDPVSPLPPPPPLVASQIVHAGERRQAIPPASCPVRHSNLHQRKLEMVRALRAAVASEIARAPAKSIANDAALTESRVKQLRCDPASISAASLMLLAQRHPTLRAALFDLLVAEMGDGEHPAVILDRVARLVR